MPDPHTDNLVVTLHGRGWSQRRIARELGVSRNTVRRVLERVALARAAGHSALPRPPRTRGSMLDAHDAFLRQRLQESPELSAVRLHEDLVERGFEGSYTIVRERVRALRPAPRAEPARAQDRPPGKYGQQDWSPYTLDFTDTGRQEVHAFSLTLAFSTRQYLDFCEGMDHTTMIRQHVRALERFGGVPRVIVYDRQKVVVLGRENGRDLYNPRFLAFATYYGFRPQALPPRSPKLKAVVEGAFRFVEGNCLAGRTFRDLAHLRSHAIWWLDHRCDVQLHSRRKQTRLQLFAQERDALLPLPAHPYDTAEVGYRVVDIYGFVVWDSVRYSVPYDHLLDIVVLRVTETEVVVYDDAIQRVARHDRHPHGHPEPVVEPGHHPRRRKVDLDALLTRITAFGEAGETFGAGVRRSQRFWGKHLGRVLALQERYDLDDIRAALDRANRYRAFDASTVERILEHTAKPRILPDSEQRARQRLRGALGHTPRRQLDAYTDAIRGDS